MDILSGLTSPTIILYALFLLIPISLLQLFHKNKSHDLNETPRPPPSPPALPVIGHLHLIGPSVHHSFHSLASRYGPLLRLRMGLSGSVLVSNSAFAKEIMKTQELNFASRPEFGGSDYYLYRDSCFVMAPYGTYWRFMKKMCMTRLLSMPQLNQLIHAREDEKEKLLRSLMELSERGESCDLGVKFATFANHVICRMAMSTRCAGDENEAMEIKELVDELQSVAVKLSFGDVFGPWIAKFDLFGYGKIMVKMLHKFDRMMDKIIEKKEMGVDGEGKEKSGGDLLDILLECFQDPEAEVKLTKKKIKGFILDIFTAGTDTTATTLEWAMAELINHPTVFKKLREDIVSVVGSTRVVQESDLPSLLYLQAVIKETLRLHPPAFMTMRECKEDCIINGFKLKAKDRMMINLYSIMRDPDHWIEPEKFNPDRFMVDPDDDDDNYKKKKQQMMKVSEFFDFLPFGGGRRSCPGASLSLLETQAVIGSLVQCFDWKVEGDKVDTSDCSNRLNLKMASPLVCYPILCFNPFVN